MRKIRYLKRALPLFVLWLFLSVIFWSWIFTFLTETDAAHQVLICVDAQVSGEDALAAQLEKGAGEDIKMVRIRPFTYYMMNPDAIQNADLFIMPLSNAENYADWLIDLPAGASDGTQTEIAGKHGYVAYDPASGTGIARQQIAYLNEPYLLFFSKGSSHLEDGEAIRIVSELMENMQ